MIDYFFGDTISTIYTLLSASAIFLFFKGKDGSEERKYATYCFFTLIVFAIVGSFYDRSDLRSACGRGDADACSKLEMQDYENELRQESYRS
jgi:hypothetical protein